jgi:hypothetical protein
MSYLYGKDAPRTPPFFADMLGQEVKVGDFVAYATTNGATPVLKAGVVTEIKWHEKMSGGYYTWKVVASFESASTGSSARVLTGRKPSQPSQGRMVRIAKGDQW